MTVQSITPLLAVYLDHKSELRRFVIARAGDAVDADDTLQDLYLKIVRAGPELQAEYPLALLYRLTANLVMDRLRRQRRALTRDGEWRRAHHLEVGGQDVVDEPSPEAGVGARQRLKALLAAVETLPPQTRRVFQLHKFEGLSHAETAVRLGISRSAVEKHISLALRRLMERLES